MHHTVSENFRDKYLKTNFITRSLLNNFFSGVQSLVPDERLDRVLEVACGEGFSTKRLARFFHNVEFFASDVTPKLVEAAQKRNADEAVTFSIESIYDLQREANSIDLVLALEVLEHLEDYRKAVAEIIRVTKKFVIVSVPWEPWWRMANMARGKYISRLGNTPGHINHWSKQALIEMLTQFAIVDKAIIRFPWILIRIRKKN